MTAQPSNIADPPGADVLTEVLRAVRLNGSVFMNGRFAAPFGVISPARWDSMQEMAHLRHASVFHLVAEGSCFLEMADGAVCELHAGDVILLPFTAEHRFWSGEPEAFQRAEDIVIPGPIEGVSTVRCGADGEDGVYVFACDGDASTRDSHTSSFLRNPPLFTRHMEPSTQQGRCGFDCASKALSPPTIAFVVVVVKCDLCCRQCVTPRRVQRLLVDVSHRSLQCMTTNGTMHT